MRHAHVLLFACDSCGLPTSVVQINEKGNVEATAGQALHAKCTFCGQEFDALAVKAKTHWVVPWHSEAQSCKA